MQPAQLNDCCHLCVCCPAAQQNLCFFFCPQCGLPVCLGAANPTEIRGLVECNICCGLFSVIMCTEVELAGIHLFLKKKKKEREETSHCLTARGLIYRVYWQRRNSHSPALFLELPHPLFVRKGEVGGRTWNEMVQPFPYLSFKWSDLSLLV